MNMIISGMDQPGNLTREEYLHDTVRIDFYKNYLTELKKGIDDGANVVGYFAWSLLDNFEWLSGYTSKFGIVYVDFTTLKRYPKDSAYWFRDMLSGMGSKAATPQTGSGTRPAGSPSATSNGTAGLSVRLLVCSTSIRLHGFLGLIRIFFSSSVNFVVDGSVLLLRHVASMRGPGIGRIETMIQ
jgi:beta-glucosidase